MPPVTVLPDRELGRLIINGQPVPIERHANRWDPRRRRHIRTAYVGERTYQLRQTGLCRAQFLRDGSVLAEAAGSIASYLIVRAIPGLQAEVAWHESVDPVDVAIGQSMILAFGAGAPGLLLGVVQFLFGLT